MGLFLYRQSGGVSIIVRESDSNTNNGTQKMVTTTARQFDDQLRWLRDCIASLKSALPNEVANESRILVNQFNETKAMKLARKNDSLELRRANLLKHAQEVLADRNFA
jgi:hypothetical protein